MALHRVLLRCVVDVGKDQPGVGDSVSVFGHEWRVDEVIPDADGGSILVCTVGDGPPVQARAGEGPNSSAAS